MLELLNCLNEGCVYCYGFAHAEHVSFHRTTTPVPKGALILRRTKLQAIAELVLISDYQSIQSTV